MFVGIGSHNERHGVGSVRRVGVFGLRIDHLLRIPVVGGDEQNVAGLLACFIDRLDRLVRFGDRYYCGIVYTCVSYLLTILSCEYGI